MAIPDNYMNCFADGTLSPSFLMGISAEMQQEIMKLNQYLEKKAIPLSILSVSITEKDGGFFLQMPERLRL